MIKSTFYFVIFFILFPLSIVFAQTNEFRGIPWGEDIRNIKGMIFKFNQEVGVKVYLREKDENRIGEAPISFVWYGFYKGKFFSVLISFKNYSNFVYLKESLESKYGSPVKLNRFIDNYIWDNNNLAIFLNYNGIKNEGVIRYSYSPIEDQKKKDLRNSASKARNSL